MNYERSSPNSDKLLLREQSFNFTEILGEVNTILEGSEKDQYNYIENRLNILTKNTEAGTIASGGIGKSRHRGFIGPKMEIYRNLTVDPLIMDDSGLYKKLFEEIKKLKKLDSFKDKSLEDTLRAIQWTIIEYFGNFSASANTDSINQKFYEDHSFSNADTESTISIKDFKGEGFAVCTEKAAAAQNLLAFLGIESDLILSNECCLPADKEKSGHYYILVHESGKEMIYDPTNPRILYDQKDNVRSILPAMYSITDEQMQSLILGGSILVEHRDGKVNDNQTIPKIHNRLYAGPKVRSK